MGRVFFIADTHFGHKNIIKYCNRPFKDTEEMDATLIKNWNNTVSKEDKVFILGDFAFGDKNVIKKYCNALNGRKVLIMGNHDKKSVNTLIDCGFSEVIKYPIVWNEFFILSHAPQQALHNSPYFNIYGHVHDDPTYKDYTENNCCVSVERINYTPILFEDLKRKVGI